MEKICKFNSSITSLPCTVRLHPGSRSEYCVQHRQIIWHDRWIEVCDAYHKGKDFGMFPPQYRLAYEFTKKALDILDQTKAEFQRSLVSSYRYERYVSECAWLEKQHRGAFQFFPAIHREDIVLGLQEKHPGLDIMSKPEDFIKGVKKIYLNVYPYEFLEANIGEKKSIERDAGLRYYGYYTSQSPNRKLERHMVALDLAVGQQKLCNQNIFETTRVFTVYIFKNQFCSSNHCGNIKYSLH